MATSNAHDLAAARIDQYLMERALRLRPEVRGSGIHKPTRPVIALSETMGVPVMEVAKRIGKQLGFEVLDRQVLDAILRDTRLGDKIIESLDEGSRSALDAWITGWLDYNHRVVDIRSFHHMVSRVVRGVSMHGDAVIVGRGANFILRGTNAFRVRLTAPLELRVAAVAAAGVHGNPISLAEARRLITEQTERRRQFIATYFRANIDDPEVYDAIFCLRRLDPDLAVGLILDAYWRATGN